MMGFGTLRVINDDWVAPDNGFGKHPHEDMEIITFIFSGVLSHQDSMGNIASIQSWEVQAMSAGSGVFHSEFNASKSNPVILFQIWIETREKWVTPQYNQLFFEESERINTWQLQVSPHKEDKKVFIHQDAYVSRVTLESGKDISYKKYREENAFYIIVISGVLHIWKYLLKHKDAIGIIGNDELLLQAQETSDILLLEIPMK